jgi:UDP-2-acetamido-2,6-beta-L-arabino-hexul-4-ose reductase
MNPKKTALITGSRGFLGRHLQERLSQTGEYEIVTHDRGDTKEALVEKVALSQVIFHLAGANRPFMTTDYERDNLGFTQELLTAITEDWGRTRATKVFVFASSKQAEQHNPYGESKKKSELAISNLVSNSMLTATIFRLPGVFGKWSKPNYNSVVATFCHNAVHGKPLIVNDSNPVITLVAVEDVVEAMITSSKSFCAGLRYETVSPSFDISVSALAEKILFIAGNREFTGTDPIVSTLDSRLRSTYNSFADEGTSHSI